MAELSKARRDELSDLRVVLSTENGRRFIYRILVRSGIYKVSYVAGHNPEHTAFNEGGRNIGLWTLAEVQQASPADYLKMMEEARNVG